MRFNRLFTFGCSFTQYWRWPTWADALGQQAEHYENWGLCGSGNCYQLYSLMECHQRNVLRPDDTVMIMWTNTSREDRYLRGRWQEGGNVYWTAGSQLPKDYVRDFTDERGFLIRDLSVIAAAKHFLEKVGCRWHFMSMVPLKYSNEHSGLGNNPDSTLTEDADVRGLYSEVLDSIRPSVFEQVFDSDWQSRPGIPGANGERRDFHPTPIEHVEYIDKMLPGYIEDASRQWMSQCEEQARSGNLAWHQPNRPIKRL